MRTGSPFQNLSPRRTPGAAIAQQDSGAWRLSIPGGPGGEYRLAQLDDTASLDRKRFPWRQPCSVKLSLRASGADLPGTWGFGLWNDPFRAGLGLGGGGVNAGALPNTAWFFQASPPNYLSLTDNLPAQGLLAAVFSSVRLPTVLLAAGLLAAPLLALPPAARWLRRLARRLVHEDAARLNFDPSAWHEYQIELLPQTTRFKVDQATVFETPLCPRPPLGLVVWIDNQFAAFSPAGSLTFGTLANPPAWIEIAFIE